MKVYAGYIERTETLFHSASGGLATALSEAVIDKGGIVAGVAYSADFHSAEYILVDKKEELTRLQGSKYMEVVRGSIYQDVKKLVEAGRLVLFIGLPCSVAAMEKVMGKPSDRLITCALICHGPTKAQVHTQYVEKLEQDYQSPLTQFSVRYKKTGWCVDSYLHAEFQNGKVFEAPFYDTAYGYAFRTMGLPGCYDCKFKGGQGDLMLGDFWSATPQDDFWNPNGVSVVFAQTEKGQELLSKTPGIRLFPSSFTRAVEQNPMIVKSRASAPNRTRFEALFAKYGLFTAVFRSHSLKHRVKVRVLKILGKA